MSDISQYLKDGFDPNSLKVSELKSVLKENGIPFASSSRKPQLVEIFQKQIIDNTKIKAELIKKQSLKDEISVSESPVSSSKNSNSKSKSKTKSKQKVKAPDQSLDLSVVSQPEIQIQPSSSPNVPQAQQGQKLATQLQPEDIILHSQAEANIHGDSLLQSSYANVQPLNTSQFPTNIHHNFQMNNVSPPPMNYQMNTNIPLQPHQLAQQQQQQQQQQQFPMNASFPLNYHPANFSYQGYPNSPYMNLPPNLYNQIPLPNNSEIFNNTTFNNDPFLNNLKSPIMNSQLSPTKLRDILKINNTAITNNDIDNTNNVIDKNKTSTNITQNEPTIKKETKSPTSKVSTITTKGKVTKLPHTPVLKSQKNTEDSKIDLKEIIKSSKKNAAATPSATSERKRRSKVSETSNIKSSPFKKENQNAIPSKSTKKTAKTNEVEQEYSNILNKTTNHVTDFLSSPETSKNLSAEEKEEVHVEKPNVSSTKIKPASDEKTFEPTNEVVFGGKRTSRKRKSAAVADVPSSSPASSKSATQRQKKQKKPDTSTSKDSSSIDLSNVSTSSPLKTSSIGKHQKPLISGSIGDTTLAPPSSAISQLVTSSTPLSLDRAYDNVNLEKKSVRKQAIPAHKSSIETSSSRYADQLKNSITENKVLGPKRKLSLTEEPVDENVIPVEDRNDKLNIHTPSIIEEEKILSDTQQKLSDDISKPKSEKKKAVLSPKVVSLIKYVFLWFLLVSTMFLFSWYRGLVLEVGFCGREVINPIFNYDRSLVPTGVNQYVNKFEDFIRPNCAPCPKHGTCYPYSNLVCDSDYTVETSFRSLFGLLPSYNRCVLDSKKAHKIKLMTIYVRDLLSKRNALFKCGKGNDRDVGMTKNDLKSLLYKLKADNIDEDEFEYYWQRTLFNLKQFKEISMNEEGIIRSHSLARLSFRCRFEILFIETLLRFKFQILGFFSILVLSLIGYRKFKTFREQRMIVKDLAEKVFKKLKEQSKEAKLDKTGSIKPYIGSIQLRDYYLSSAAFSKNTYKNIIWSRVTKAIESNTNIHCETLEVSGEIMKVWEWISGI